MTDRSASLSEFSRPFALAQLGEEGRRDLTLEAAPDEAGALAQRFGVSAVSQLKAEVRISGEAKEGLRASGKIKARVVQPCVVTLEPVESALSVPFAVRLVAEGPTDGTSTLFEGEVELTEEEAEGEDTETYFGETVDLGEIVAQTLALHIPQYPRAAGADDEVRALMGQGDGAAMTPAGENPFAALASLKARMDGQET